MNSVRDRIAKFIEFKRLSNRAFSTSIGASATYFTSTKTIGSDNLEAIARVYPDLNIEWVVTGKGQMLREVVGKENSLEAAIKSGIIDPADTSDIMEMPIDSDEKIKLLRNRVTLRNIEIMALKRILDDYLKDQKQQPVNQGSSS